MDSSDTNQQGSLGGSLRIAAPDQAEWSYAIDRPVVRIGRADVDTDLVLPHGWVSRAHARLYADRLPYRIEDLGSSNGTTVNDVPLPSGEVRPLQDGDVIAIGPFRLTLVAPTPPEPAPAEPDAEHTAAPERVTPAGIGVQAMPRGRPAPPRPPEPPTEAMTRPQEPTRWVGMPATASRWLQYLPPIYADPESGGDGFLGRFLLVFEDLLGPVEQMVGHFGLYLDPTTAPANFLGTLDAWLGGLLEERLPEDTKRELLRQAHWLYQARGTRAGLTRHIEICTGITPEIIENVTEPHHFAVTLPTGGRPVDARMVERIIERHRPAHTSYSLTIA